MKKFVPFMFASLLVLAGCGTSPERLVNNGNEAYANQDYAGALVAYQEAQAESPELAEPYYNNAANAHYRRGDFESALQEIKQTLLKDDGDLVQNSFYNLGNNFYQAQTLADRLAQTGLEGKLIGRVNGCWSGAELGRFSPDAADPANAQNLLTEVEVLIKDLEKYL